MASNRGGALQLAGPAAVDELSQLNQRFAESSAKLRQLVGEVEDEEGVGSVSFATGGGFDERMQDWRTNMRTLAKIAETVKEKAVPTGGHSTGIANSPLKRRNRESALKDQRALHGERTDADAVNDDDQHVMRPSEIALKVVTLKADIRVLSKHTFDADPHARRVMETAESSGGPTTDARNAAPSDRKAAYWQREVGGHKSYTPWHRDIAPHHNSPPDPKCLAIEDKLYRPPDEPVDVDYLNRLIETRNQYYAKISAWLIEAKRDLDHELGNDHAHALDVMERKPEIKIHRDGRKEVVTPSLSTTSFMQLCRQQHELIGFVRAANLVRSDVASSESIERLQRENGMLREELTRQRASSDATKRAYDLFRAELEQSADSSVSVNKQNVVFR